MHRGGAHSKGSPGLGQVEGARGWVCAQQWRAAGLGLMPWEVGKGTVVTWVVALTGACVGWADGQEAVLGNR